MDLISNGKGSLGTATVINKQEEMPYEGKPISNSVVNNPDGMQIGSHDGNMGYKPNAAPRPKNFYGKDKK